MSIWFNLSCHFSVCTNEPLRCVILVSIAVVSIPDFTHATNVSYQLHTLSSRLNPSTNKVGLLRKFVHRFFKPS
ncbi:hypothetical protein VCR15J2_50132 [Vibrio coralliirubri]|nr:hypothetical protein VCR15J2_50132 [Vibrio coralliirubri]